MLLDPNFERTVVLLLDSDENGALGVVLNRPTAVPVGRVLPDWTTAVGTPDVVFQGGPVDADAALSLAALAPGGAEPLGWRPLFGNVGIVDLDAPTQHVVPALSGLRIFAGYAGWSSDQLEGEIEEGAWYVVPSISADLLTGDPQTLWRRVLRRQPGELAWLSTRPADPTWN
jgi:putative transcriptional regulator